MSDWQSMLKSDPMEWLLEEENPSVRYFTLKELMDKPEHDPEVQQAKRNIMQSGIVPELLLKQHESEYLKAYPRFYTYKYKGLVWSLILLAELGADSSPQIKEQCEYLLGNSQERQDGGFSMQTAVKTGGGRISEVIPCLTGNMVWSLIRFGYLDDPRLQKGIDWLTQYMCLNDGTEDAPQVPPYNHYEMCWGKHTCHMGVVKALKALSAVPEEKRSIAVNETIAKTSEFMLKHHIYKRSSDLKKNAKPGWLKFGFPLMYQTDVLEILGIFSDLGISDKRMEEAFTLVLSKQDDMGRWKVENTYNSERLLLPMEQKNEQSKWLTLRAMKVIKKQFKEERQ